MGGCGENIRGCGENMGGVAKRSGRVRAGQPPCQGGPRSGPKEHRPSVSRDGLHANVSSLHVSLTTGSQAVSAHALRAIRVSNGSVPLAAHRPSVPLAGVESCPASWASFDAGGQVCTDWSPSRLGPAHSGIRVPSDSPFQFDVTRCLWPGRGPRLTDRFRMLLPI
jgi:hypothetical protein